MQSVGARAQKHTYQKFDRNMYHDMNPEVIFRCHVTLTFNLESYFCTYPVFLLGFSVLYFSMFLYVLWTAV